MASGQGMPSARALAERAIRSVLEQPDPIGTEVIVSTPARPSDRGGVSISEYVREIFPDELASGRLQLTELEVGGSGTRLRNSGASRAQGSFVAFIDGPQSWPLDQLQKLEPLLKGHDLLFGVKPEFPGTPDWLKTLLSSPSLLVPGTSVIRRTLFDELGGFKEGLGSQLLSALPGQSGSLDFGLLTRALVRLGEQGERERALPLRMSVPRVEDSGPLQAMGARLEALQDTLSLLQTGRSMPKRYWGAMLKQVLAAGKKAAGRK